MITSIETPYNFYRITEIVFSARIDQFWSIVCWIYSRIQSISSKYPSRLTIYSGIQEVSSIDLRRLPKESHQWKMVCHNMTHVILKKRSPCRDVSSLVVRFTPSSFPPFVYREKDTNKSPRRCPRNGQKQYFS